MSKTFEFKLDLNRSTITQLKTWQETCRQLWNDGLSKLEEFDRFTAPFVYETTKNEKGKEVKHYKFAPCCPLPWKYRRLDPDLPWQDGNYVRYIPAEARPRRGKRRGAPASPAGVRVRLTMTPEEREQAIANGEDPEQWFQVVQDFRLPILGTVPGEFIPFWQNETIPRIEPLGKFSLQYHFAKKNHKDWKRLQELPAWFARGICDDLWQAWKRFKTPGRAHLGRPRFKRFRDAPNTLSYGDGKQLTVLPHEDGVITPEGIYRDGFLKGLPLLGTIRVKHLWKDWGNYPISTATLIRKADGWYLQLTAPDSAIFYWLTWAEFAVHTPAIALCWLRPRSSIVTALALPYTDDVFAVDDRGKVYRSAAPGKEEQFQRKREKRQHLLLLNQQRASRQQDAVNRIKTKLRQFETFLFLEMPPLLRTLQVCQLPGWMFLFAIANYHRRTVGKNLAKTRNKISRIHANKARQTKSAQQKIANSIARRSGRIVVEDKEVGTHRKPKPRPRPGTPKFNAEVASIFRRLDKRLAKANDRSEVVAIAKDCAAEVKWLKQQLAQVKQTDVVAALQAELEKLNSLLQKIGPIANQEAQSTRAAMRPEDIRPPHYEPNGASRVAEENQERAGLAIGQMVSYVQAKASEHGSRFSKAKPKQSRKQKGKATPIEIAQSLKVKA